MRQVPIVGVITLATFLAFSSSAEDPAKAEATASHTLPILKTTTGETYHEVEVIRADVEGLVFRHRGGIARVSLFLLSPELQQQFNFDPVAGMKAYREQLETDRARRKEQFLEEQKRLAKEDEARRRQDLLETAKREWYPIEATVIRSAPEGLFVVAKRVVFVPTKEISTLGFEREGTPRRETRRFGNGLIFLRGASQNPKTSKTWKGYLEPTASGFLADPTTGAKTVPVHLAVPAP